METIITNYSLLVNILIWELASGGSGHLRFTNSTEAAMLSAPQKLTSRALNGIQADPFAVLTLAKIQFPHVFFFEAAPGIGLPARFSVIGIGPFDVLREKNGIAELERFGQRTLAHKPFFSALSELVEEIQCDEELPTPYHGGGVFGLIGYDSVPSLEPKLRNLGNFRASSPYPSAEVFLTRTMIVFDHARATIHLIDTAPGELLGALEALIKYAPESQPKQIPEGHLNLARLIPSLGFQEFAARTQELKKHIRNGDIFQAVLAERFEMRTTASALEIFAVLKEQSRAPYHFFFSLGERTIFGASPETLIAVEKKTVRSYPIAGTKPRGKSAADDRKLARSLSRSRKEAAEHLMLVDLARNDIGRIASPGSVEVSEFRVLKYLPNVIHLASTVKGKLAEGKMPAEALAASFPAGTLSGAPKVRAMEILADLEPHARGLYGGAVVAFDAAGGLDSCIAIRAAEMTEDQIVLRAGAGIVADSKAKNEYAEINHKLKSLTDAIHGAEMAILPNRENQ